MKVWMLWHGGNSYSPPENDDAEEFASLAEARAEFHRRECGWDPMFPCVEESTAWILFSDPRESDGDVYPDRVLSVGPRGGLVESHG